MFAAQFYFLSELALEVIQNGRHGASFTIDYFELSIATGWWCSVVRNGYWFTDTAEQFAKSILLASVESQYE